ncbi:MAG TPA: hypothetical protein DCR93_13890 [Cytophagales bacterium]|nr:hypothetical protein [Cytophagales bacterium]HAP60531.1 hypothetical protein [Cytophagales bacterium]
MGRTPKSSPPFPEWLADFTEKTGVKIEHGDYQRIANLCPKPKGSGVYTADYIRKVLLDIRGNREITAKAKKYLRRKAWLLKGFQSENTIDIESDGHQPKGIR